MFHLFSLVFIMCSLFFPVFIYFFGVHGCFHVLFSPSPLNFFGSQRFSYVFHWCSAIVLWCFIGVHLFFIGFHLCFFDFRWFFFCFSLICLWFFGYDFVLGWFSLFLFFRVYGLLLAFFGLSLVSIGFSLMFICFSLMFSCFSLRLIVFP